MDDLFSIMQTVAEFVDWYSFDDLDVDDWGRVRRFTAAGCCLRFVSVAGVVARYDAAGFTEFTLA